MTTDLYITSLLERAIYLASCGVYLIPEDPETRIPVWSNWPSHASCDARRIRKWFSQPWGIGVVPGPSGLVILDIDVKHGDGIAALSALVDDYGPLPETLTVRSPSGGRHYYFRAPIVPDGMRWDNALVPGQVEIKTGNRKVSCTPGKHRVSGWSFLPDLPNLPEWVTGLALRPSRPPAPQAEMFAEVDTAYGKKAKQSITQRLLSAQAGDRNNALFRAAASTYGLIAGGELCPFPDPEEELKALGLALGLKSSEAHSAIASGKKAGFASPQCAPDRRLGGAL